MQINSNEYWDTRFQTDWEEYGGDEQSRYFARILIEALPEWFKNDIRSNEYSMCDWGCAEGDGTDIFSNSFKKKVTGIDFSETAIQHASEKYLNSNFINADLLNKEDGKNTNFDIFISSNTLEHFHDPFCVLSKLQHYANKAIILSVPYEETNRIKEHHFTFLPDNIPLNLEKKWLLGFYRIINCREHEPSFWPGKQIVLAYFHVDYWLQKTLCISDVQGTTTYDARFFLERLDALTRELKNSEKEVSSLKVKEENLLNQINTLQQLCNESLFRKVVRSIRRVLGHA